MTKIKFNTWLNNQGRKPEVNNDPSETVEGQSYTVRQLVSKYTAGIPPDVVKVPQGFDDPDMENDYDPTQRPDFDLTDVTEIQNELNERAEQREAKVRKDKEAEAKRKLKTEIETELKSKDIKAKERSDDAEVTETNE